MPSARDSGSKPVNKDYCFRHSLLFEGWECPLCAGDTAAPGGGGGSSPPAGRTASAPGAPPGSGATPNSAPGPASRPASLAASKEAAHLLDAGAAREALEGAERAIELDRSNLHAYVVAARAAQKTGDFHRQEELIEEAARLLHTAEYQRDSHWYYDLLRGVRDAAMARPIVASFIQAGPWPPAEAAGLVQALATRDLAGEALRLLESIPPEHRSLTLCAHGAQLTARPFSLSDPEVDAYLARVPAAQRDGALDEFRGLCEERVFPMSTLMMLRDSLRERYRGWTPEVHRLRHEAARAEAAATLEAATVKPGVSLALKAGGTVLGASLALAVVLGRPILLPLGALLSLGAAAGGFVYGRDAELERRLPEVLPGVLERMGKEETSRWELVLDDQHALFRGAGLEEAPRDPANAASDKASGSEAPAASAGSTQTAAAGPH